MAAAQPGRVGGGSSAFSTSAVDSSPSSSSAISSAAGGDTEPAAASSEHNATVAAPAAAAAPASASHTPYPRRRASSSASASASGGDAPWGQTAGSHVNAAASSSTKFALTKNFLDKWRHKTPPFGYNGLGELVYRRTYSRKRASELGNNHATDAAADQLQANETWAETVERVVNGTYNMQKRWIESHELGWNAWKAQKSAQEMYERMFEMKFLPPGRGLWAMGSPITETRGLFAALNNCLTMDHQILTSVGFLFHSEMVARQQRGEVIQVACFHEATQTLTYENIGASDVLLKAIDSAANPKDPQHQIVDFECAENADGVKAALSCTADHDAYLRFSVVRKVLSDKYKKMHAGDVLKPKHQKKTREARMLTLAANGVAPRKPPPRVFSLLGLNTDDQRNAFCELYGQCLLRPMHSCYRLIKWIKCQAHGGKWDERKDG